MGWHSATDECELSEKEWLCNCINLKLDPCLPCKFSYAFKKFAVLFSSHLILFVRKGIRIRGVFPREFDYCGNSRSLAAKMAQSIRPCNFYFG